MDINIIQFQNMDFISSHIIIKLSLITSISSNSKSIIYIHPLLEERKILNIKLKKAMHVKLKDINDRLASTSIITQ